MMTGKILVVALLVFYSAGANAQAGELSGTRPNAGAAPEQLTLRVGLLDIADIDDREQVFTADLFLEIAWQDARLAVGAGEGADLRTVSLNEIWNPRLTVINNRGLKALLPETATVDGQGKVTARQRLAGPLAVDLDLHEFPFDRQRLPIEIVSYQYAPSEIAFSSESEMVANFEKLGGNGWTFKAVEAAATEYRLREGGRGVSGMTFSVLAEREGAYYALTLALPMTLILFLAWMVHWLPLDIIPARIGTASAAVFSLIAFGVSFRLTLPKIAYLTDADRFVLYSTLLVLGSLAVTVTTIRWVSTGRTEAAERLSRQARLAFPFLYGLIIMLIFTT